MTDCCRMSRGGAGREGGAGRMGTSGAVGETVAGRTVQTDPLQIDRGPGRVLTGDCLGDF